MWLGDDMILYLLLPSVSRHKNFGEYSQRHMVADVNVQFRFGSSSSSSSGRRRCGALPDGAWSVLVWKLSPMKPRWRQCEM